LVFRGGSSIKEWSSSQRTVPGPGAHLATHNFKTTGCPLPTSNGQLNPGLIPSGATSTLLLTPGPTHNFCSGMPATKRPQRVLQVITNAVEDGTRTLRRILVFARRDIASEFGPVEEKARDSKSGCLFVIRMIGSSNGQKLFKKSCTPFRAPDRNRSKITHLSLRNIHLPAIVNHYQRISGAKLGFCGSACSPLFEEWLLPCNPRGNRISCRNTRED
jgi:hypothetical protein